jgi:hypothetical protein
MDSWRGYSNSNFATGYPKVHGYYLKGYQKPVYTSDKDTSNFDLFDEFQVETKPK